MSQRLAKFNSVLQHEVGAALTRELGPDILATVTEASVSPDLAEARIWVGVWPDTDESWEAVSATRAALQAHLAAHLRSKRTPRMQLVRDLGGSHADRINQLLKLQ
jgi:ribosome-binding factor A